jgi:hypothetical protein
MIYKRCDSMKHAANEWWVLEMIQKLKDNELIMN